LLKALTTGETTACRRRERAFTIAEVAIVTGALVLPLFAAAHLLIYGKRLGDANRERGLALASACRAVEELRGGEPPFEEIFASLQANGGFLVPGLEPREGDADGEPGSIEFPTAPAAPSQLREDFTASFLGLDADIDLNGDGVVDALDHSGDYLLLPVAVRVEWEGIAGDSSVVLRTFLTRR
jgi:hypothetical protein